jgi:hypothetical protein
MPDASSVRRARRIERRCIAPVIDALHTGQISARSADVFLRLPASEQALELERRLRLAEERERVSRIAAKTIEQYLDGRAGKGQIDMAELAATLREALLSGCRPE